MPKRDIHKVNNSEVLLCTQSKVEGKVKFDFRCRRTNKSIVQNLNVMVFEIVLESARWALLEAEHSSTVYSTFISTVLQFSSGKSTCSYFESSVAVNHLASHFPTAGTLGSSLSWQPLI